MPELPFQGTIKLRDIKGNSNTRNIELIIKETGPLQGESQSFPKITPGLQSPKSIQLLHQHDGPSYYYKRDI